MSQEYDPLASVQAAGPPGTISFIYGLPDPSTFPVDELRDAFDQVFGKSSALALQYGPEQGYGPLIDYLREKIRREEGISLERPQIMLSGGASQALDHICSLFTRPGDYVLVEAPTYHESLQLFRDHRLQPLQIPIDEQGLKAEELASCLNSLRKKGEEARLLYVIPNFQNPSGITLSEKRRKAVLDVVKETNILVVEDDVYFDLSFEESKLPSLFSLEHREGVIRLGSFSKIIAPGLRLGWIMGPSKSIELLTESGLRRMGGGPNPLAANAISLYCQKGHLESHIDSVRSVYRKRRDIMLETLQSDMPEGVHWTKPQGGFFVWLTLPHHLRAEKVVKQAKSNRLLILAGDPFFAQSVPGQHLRLAFSYLAAEKIREGIEKLAHILRSSEF
ncbi:MAG: PLP-dependent aminotransferase family protein [Candidatus Aminicenantes bacterium]